MSLKKFKTSTTAANDGVLFILGKNSDGSEYGFRLGRMTNQNAAYAEAQNEFVEKNSTNGQFDISNLTEEQAEAIQLKIFVDTVLKGWQNLQLEDDGKALEYNRENAMALFSDPDWRDLYHELRSRAMKADNFRHAEAQKTAKN